MGHLYVQINGILEERDISRDAACKALDIPRSSFNKYCRDGSRRMDANLIRKLCEYFDCGVEDLIEYIKD